MLYRLAILSGPRARQQITVDQAPMVIGSAPDCAVRLEDEEVADRHAVIEHKGDSLLIRDLGSPGALLVNRREVRESRLIHGDEIEIGRTRFLVQARVRAEVAGAPEGSRPRRRLAGLMLLLVLCLGGTAGIVWRFRLWEQPPSAGRTPHRPELDTEEIPGLWPPPGAPVAEPAVEPTSAAVPPPPAPSTEEVQKIRDDLAGLRQLMQALVEKQAFTSSPPPAATAATATVAGVAPPAPPAGPAAIRVSAEPTNRQDRIEALMTDIRLAAALKEYDRAERLLAAVLALDGEYWPAFEEQALLLERQGHRARAEAVWQQVAARSRDAHWTEKARKEQARLGRLRERESAPAPGRIALVAVDTIRFPSTEAYADLRALNVTLQRNGPAANSETVRVAVSFFDRDPATGRIVPTRALVPREPLTVAGEWAAGEQKTLTATYAVPAAGGAAQPPEFYGYVVRVYSGGRLQDQAAKPAELLGTSPAAAP